MRPPPPKTGAPNPLAAAQIDLFARRNAGAQQPAQRVVSVTELTRELKGMLESRFVRVSVRGEISNLRPAASGHVYFTLKDDGACLTAVLFRADAQRLKFQLKDGQLVVARGRISVYEARGQYQLICDAVEPEGAGALALAFEQLKARLSKEGLFDPARKKKIPFLPRCIGVVTSPSGAALQDFLRVLHDRFPIPVLIAPARVQGAGAAEEIARGLQRLAASGRVDVIVLTRGGGSLEDLWAFNEEVLARAVAACPIPTVSAVGHEVDFTICDFVADQRCATPTDAAKTLAPPRDELLRALDKHRRHLREIVHRQLGLRRERLQHRSSRLADPRRLVANERLALDEAADRMRAVLARALSQDRARLAGLGERLGREHPRSRLLRLSRVLGELGARTGGATRQRLSNERERLAALGRRLSAASPAPRVAREHRRVLAARERIEKALQRRLGRERVRFSTAAAGLDSLSPLAVLSRGYAIVFAARRNVLRSAADVSPGAPITVLLSDRSEIDAQVIGSRPPRGDADK